MMHKNGLALLTMVTAMSACSLISPVEDRPMSPETREAAHRVTIGAQPAQLAESGSRAYIRVRAKSIGVKAAIDDGKNTFIALDHTVGNYLEIFDANGRQINFCRHGDVIALPGLHAGLLLRRGKKQASYIAPNPKATRFDHFPWFKDFHLVMAKEELESIQSAMPAFNRTMKNVDETVAKRKTPRAARLQANAARYSHDIYMIRRNGDVMVSLYFALGQDRILRPIKRLELLKQEAADSRTIHIMAFTDSTGSADYNAWLADKRSKHVLRELLSAGIHVDRIKTVFNTPNARPASNMTPAGRASNRRVDILFKQAIRVTGHGPNSIARVRAEQPQ